jgi:hypothetical protein
MESDFNSCSDGSVLGKTTIWQVFGADFIESDFSSCSRGSVLGRTTAGRVFRKVGFEDGLNAALDPGKQGVVMSGFSVDDEAPGD